MLCYHNHMTFYTPVPSASGGATGQSGKGGGGGEALGHARVIQA